ncbi:diguanylate cyclase domain-containing protein [Niveibacterium sp.]|uniref:diguanylate cyclase domain-containing protein n=1 Tax=Niveibacterium sp. TaxID=2017444 RepID=UPI0035AF8565
MPRTQIRHRWREVLCSLLAALAGLLLPAIAASAVELDPAVAARIDAVDAQGRSDPSGAILSVDALLKSETGSAARIALLTMRGTYQTNANQPDAALATAATLDALASQDAKAAALIVRAHVVRMKGDLSRALELAEQARTTLATNGDSRQGFRLEMMHGALLLELGRQADALAAYQNALSLAERLNSKVRVFRALDSMATLFVDAGELDKAIEANRKATRYAQELAEAPLLAQSWDTSARVASLQQDRDAELKAAKAALGYARKAGEQERIETMLINLGDTYLKLGRYADALEVTNEAIRIARQISDPHGLIVALANAGQAQIRLGRLDEGRTNVEEALSTALKLESRAQYASLLAEYGEALEAAGDYKNAINAYHRERRASKALAESSRKNALLELDARYQSEKKQREIELLNRDNALKSAQLHNRTLQQRVWLLAAGLLTTGLLAVALLYRRVRDANQQLSESNRMLKVRSERDALTGLFNRRYFQEAMRTRSASGGFIGGLMLLDIDHFKRVNDTYGHAAGDVVITTVAQRLQDTMRETDLVVRWGGEEFLIAVGPMPAEQFDRLAERLLHAISRDPVPYGDQYLSVTISIGYASFPLAPGHLSLEWERGINQVDMALYIAKAQGRNRACGIREVMASNELELDEIERSFETAWRDGRVKLGLITGAPPG